MINTEHVKHQLEDLTPGSAEERAVLENVRAAKRHASLQIGHEAIQGFKPAVGELQYVSPEGSRNAHHIAVEQVTGQHQVVVNATDKLH